MADLTYRDMRADDFADLHALVSYWRVTRQLGSWPWPAQADFTKSRCRPYKGAGFVWAICLHDRLIGTLGVTGGNLGYNLHPDHHGKGIISRATHHAVTQAFETLAHDTLTAGTWHDNAGSARVLRKLGFVHWQTRYTHARARNAPTLLHEYRLTRAAWDGLRTGSQ